MTKIREILRNQFHTSDEKVIIAEDYVRIWIPGKEELKVEMVNDVAERWGTPQWNNKVPVDTIGNDNSLGEGKTPIEETMPKEE